MREFNLEQALAGHPVCTRDGRPVTQLVKFDVNEGYLLCGVIDGEFYRWGDDGTWGMDALDLFMAPTKKTGWVARYNNDYVWGVYKDESEALVKAPGALSYHEITWEE